MFTFLNENGEMSIIKLSCDEFWITFTMYFGLSVT